MKKFYEAPVAEELYADAPALMTNIFLSLRCKRTHPDRTWQPGQ